MYISQMVSSLQNSVKMTSPHPRLRGVGECGASPRLSRSASCAPSAGVVHNLTAPRFRGSQMLRGGSVCGEKWRRQCGTKCQSGGMWRLKCGTKCQPGSHGVAMLWITPADRSAAREPGVHPALPQMSEPRSARCRQKGIRG